MLYYIVSIFLSAFLIFQVQPMIAKYILPWFGGTSAVWSTVELFFQVLLTGGYAYAHWLSRAKNHHRRLVIHLALLGLVLIQLMVLSRLWPSPITPDSSWEPHGLVNPIWEIFKLLIISVGPAYFLLSANSPLMQVWFNRALPGRSPYSLYALSNLGSLLGLITYPIFVEPQWTVPQQGMAWSLGFGLFALLAIFGTIRILGTRMDARQQPEVVEHAAPRPGAGVASLWLALAACASTLFLATTTHITQDVAVIPFLWILPLTIYLLTFIIAFSSEKWYSRQIYLGLFFVGSIAFVRILYAGPAISLPIELTVYSLVLFIACMICHGELYRLRPDPSRLTYFYLMVSIGGALGGIFVNFAAPYLFTDFWELPIAMLLCWVLLLIVMTLRTQPRRSNLVNILNRGLVMSGIILFGYFTARYIIEKSTGSLFTARNFYGVVRVKEQVFPQSGLKAYSMVHGITVHGLQMEDASEKELPTAYYYEQSGVGLTILNFPRQSGGLRVGVLGLGAGTLAVYGQSGDVYRFYEINPVVIDLARGRGGYFSFLSDSKAKIEIVQGDARISLEQEAANGVLQKYDVLVLDTFSGDSIPVHLIDKEAFAVYLSRLQPDGVLAVHITNTFLDLKPVIFDLAKYYRLNMSFIESQGNGTTHNFALWALLTRSPTFLSIPAISTASMPLDHYSTNIPLWTDNYSNLFQILAGH
jgi:hypothetical protein